ncbi:hypothetical protein niasHS_011293 [Heterodera schachtii]|uniref:RING-type domain-containing protein n=1 Tax=Heterodera schachtii TaxID=97005 RepID=A0ABD2IW42_HETSC
MRQSVDKKGQNAEKMADKTKANLQRMLQLLGTVINQIDDTEQLTDVKIINKLPQRIVQEGEQSAESCAICLGNYEHGESVITLPCAKGKHEFHTKCIQLWFKKHINCPICRKEIGVPEENGSASNTSNSVPVL